ncbi:nuclear transport factor 2 family protein [Flammeovirga sp. SubArs3]|uniref:YybH family protein n=1 Tax=Flammeovirga sp. SubArs3 TaxID=2995316 RepID=UPI00248CC65B|nr:nuclear transport factor 2 family protein [Flammeovirga sp. SubArs3]
MKKLFLLLLIFLSLQGYSQSKDSDLQKIQSILNKQEKAWNRADLEGFMDGYWESEDLLFIGKSGVTNGWQATLDNYKRSYPDAKAMGKLHFTILKTEKLSDNVALVIGKWHLSRESKDLEGHFSLTWKKINGKWVIIADHSS